MCPMNEMVWNQEYEIEKVAFVSPAIILNMLSFPVTTVMCAGDNAGEDKTQIAK